MSEEQSHDHGGQQSIGDFDADQLAQMVATASDEQLAEGMNDPESRKSTLDEIFRRMAEHVEPAKARGQRRRHPLQDPRRAPTAATTTTRSCSPTAPAP